MGIYDRDYYRTPQRSGLGQVRMWSVTTWLIILNVVVFLVEAFLVASHRQNLLSGRVDPASVTRAYLDPIQFYGAFTIDAAFIKYQLWRVITCQFLHDQTSITHILFNMIGLYMFGPVVELNLGRRRYTFFYLLCGIAGPVMYTVLWALNILTPHVPALFLAAKDTPLIGASAGIFGILVAVACIAPNSLVYVYFIELRMKYLAIIMMGIAAYTVFFHGTNAGGQAAHLGGGLLGWVLIRSHGVLDVVEKKRLQRGRKVKDWSRDLNR